MKLHIIIKSLKCSPLLPIAEAGEIAGPGAQVVQAGVLLGGAGPGAGP